MPCARQPDGRFQIKKYRSLGIPNFEQSRESIYRRQRDSTSRPLVGARRVVISVRENRDSLRQGGFDYLFQVLVPIGKIEQKFAHGSPRSPPDAEQNLAQGNPELRAAGLARHEAANAAPLQMRFCKANLEALARPFDSFERDEHATALA